ncbi:hypothetical protein GCM10027515_22420 [Schumannella luteola]|uniref:Uncharacterized protein n=1 Tax=Schumannella luteola TaxID=472059 RepID=A0A852YDV0_9MICO|nr:hypothetical protein [Schumannella luteola]NYG99962.1 hypothetical protein [Schumannella luteola]TPX05494.1 hypothetical protein FJ656_06285 [Schumannella luteola]
MVRRAKPTFADIVAEVVATSAATAPEPMRPGDFSRTGTLSDPAGIPVTRERDRIGPAEAAELVGAGAWLAFEGCGCGGGGGCAISWTAPEAVTAPVGRPRFVRGCGSPTWIDSWVGDGTRVVFAHGDVKWGDLFD